MRACTEGFSKRAGIFVNRRVPPIRTVLLANSSAVNVMPAGITGLMLSATRVKSPIQSVGWGNCELEKGTGATWMRFSYDMLKKVFLRFPQGMGPPKDPPISFRLKYGVGYWLRNAVGVKAACCTLSRSCQAASAEFLLS